MRDGGLVENSCFSESKCLSHPQPHTHHYHTNTLLQGTIPSDIGKLSLLQKLALASNRFTGSLPEELCDLVYLTDLYFGFNQIIGNIPSCIGQLSNMLILFVSAIVMTPTPRNKMSVTPSTYSLAPLFTTGRRQLVDWTHPHIARRHDIATNALVR